MLLPARGVKPEPVGEHEVASYPEIFRGAWLLGDSALLNITADDIFSYYLDDTGAVTKMSISEVAEQQGYDIRIMYEITDTVYSLRIITDIGSTQIVRFFGADTIVYDNMQCTRYNGNPDNWKPDINDPPTEEPGTDEPGEEEPAIDSELKPYVDEILSKVMSNVSNAGTYTVSGDSGKFVYTAYSGTGVAITNADFGANAIATEVVVVLELMGPRAVQEPDSSYSVFTPDSFRIYTPSGKPIQIMDMSDVTSMKNILITLTDVSGTVKGVTISEIDAGVEGQAGIVTDADSAVLTADTIKGSIN